MYLHNHCLARIVTTDAVGICFSFCLTGASIKKCNFISFHLLIKLLTCASPPPQGSIAVYTNNVGKHNTPMAMLEVTLSKDGCSGLLRRRPSGIGCFHSYINHIKLEELYLYSYGPTVEVITYTDSVIVYTKNPITGLLDCDINNLLYVYTVYRTGWCVRGEWIRSHTHTSLTVVSTALVIAKHQTQVQNCFLYQGRKQFLQPNFNTLSHLLFLN